MKYTVNTNHVFEMSSRLVRSRATSDGRVLVGSLEVRHVPGQSRPAGTYVRTASHPREGAHEFVEIFSPLSVGFA